MGGDQVVSALTDEETEHALGDAIRAAEGERYFELIGEVETMRDARGLIEELKRRGHVVVLASSAKPEEVDHYLDLLDARELADAWTTAGDVEATKPHPDLVHAALERAREEGGRDGAADGRQWGGGDTTRADPDAVMIGDTPWDVKAAKQAGVPTIAVLTGGFSEQELVDAGAIGVYESVSALLEALDETPLA
jgi:phosphoglycolate phosphatase-like HAD superfamily hydrolase